MKVINWKTNLVIIWISQLLSIAGFFFALPFGPYYIQELGVHDPAKIKFWVALFGAGPPLTLAIFSPIWGTLADRYGRRLMLLRANFGAMAVLGLMGTVQSVETLIILRFIQGIFTGTVVAAQAMVAANTPERSSGVALGSLSAAVYMGSMAGTFLGGMFAEYFGYRYAFFGSGILLCVAGLLVLLGAKENFVRPKLKQPKNRNRRTKLFSGLQNIWPILLLMAAMGFTRQFDTSFFPLLIQHILGTMEGAAFWTGTVSAVAAAAGFLAGIVFGRLADHFNEPKIARFSVIFASFFLIFHWWSQSILFLSFARFGMIFCAGGLDPLFQIWLAKETPPEKRGTVFGWGATARSLGWFLAPIISGIVASGFGIRSIYIVEAILFIGFLPLISWVARTLSPGSNH